MTSTKNGLVYGAVFFIALWLLIFLHHEWTISKLPHPSIHDKTNGKVIANSLRGDIGVQGVSTKGKERIKFDHTDLEDVVEQNQIPIEHHDDGKHDLIEEEHAEHQLSLHEQKQFHSESNIVNNLEEDASTVNTGATAHNAGDITTTTHGEGIDLTTNYVDYSLYRHDAKRGELVCNGQSVDSEVIYWKIVPGDNEYESPITPHHGLHHDRYLSFEYDNGGWNNVRMGMESLIVVAHAMGRTLVVPPQQHLYLLQEAHKDKKDTKEHDEMGFEDFFDIGSLRNHKGFNVLHMEEFLEKEAVTGGLKGRLPPQNSTKLWGTTLWSYLNKVADAKPQWQGRYLAFPKVNGDFNLTHDLHDSVTAARMKAFGGDRSPVFYDQTLREAHHIHFPAHSTHRLLQHHYAFAFFADHSMQSFYKRFVRDYMRYKDNIQCAGAELVRAVRADAKKIAPESNGEYYALHIRRGDFQYKEVKHSAEEIVKHLHFSNGTAIIPPGSVVYISTDDPDGVCKNCYVMRKPCTEYQTPKPPGCPEDPSWNGFLKFGWKIRFLRDYLSQGMLKEVNPNTYGMVESIVCTRAKVFAGTYFSTFTGYIHRLRGYHGLGEQTYYHSKNYIFYLQKQKSIGHGFSREWRAGWTDDAGQLI